MPRTNTELSSMVAPPLNTRTRSSCILRWDPVTHHRLMADVVIRIKTRPFGPGPGGMYRPMRGQWLVIQAESGAQGLCDREARVLHPPRSEIFTENCSRPCGAEPTLD